jgi:hypothetical protein
MCSGMKVAYSNHVGVTNLEVWIQITKHVCYTVYAHYTLCLFLYKIPAAGCVLTTSLSRVPQ